jgi:hypothetical protein
MPFPPGFARLSPGDLKVFRQFYEESVEAQPMDKLGAWFLSTYDHLEAGEFTHALGLLDEVLRKSPDYSGFLAAKHLLSQVDSCSGVTLPEPLRFYEAAELRGCELLRSLGG